MFLSPIFGGCKYTNYFLFINKKPEFQWLGMLITLLRPASATWSITERRQRICHFATITQVWGRFCEWRCPKHDQNARKRDRHAEFQAKSCVTISATCNTSLLWHIHPCDQGPSRRFSGKKLRDGKKNGVFRRKCCDWRENFHTFAMTSWHFERDVANDRRERRCKR